MFGLPQKMMYNLNISLSNHWIPFTEESFVPILIEIGFSGSWKMCWEIVKNLTDRWTAWHTDDWHPTIRKLTHALNSVEWKKNITCKALFNAKLLGVRLHMSKPKQSFQNFCSITCVHVIEGSGIWNGSLAGFVSFSFVPYLLVVSLTYL